VEPLRGSKVLDFTTLLPGPLATLMLAEAGADVLKVERPEGELGRRNQPRLDGESVQFAMLNRGKRSVVADLKRDADRAVILALAAKADVLVEQFRPGVMNRLGLGYAQVAAANPGIVYCSITGFGQTGPDAQRAGHDLTYLARNGLLALGGEAGVPVLPPGLIADIGGGTYPAVVAIVLALLERARTGEGRHLDIAMTEAGFTWMARAMASVVAEGTAPAPGQGRHTGGSPRYGVWPTADGKALAAAPLEEVFWQRFCDVIGLPNALRPDSAPAGEARAEISRRIRACTSSEWASRFEGVDACVELVQSVAEAMAAPHRATQLAESAVQLASGRTVPALPLSGFGASGARLAPSLGSVALDAGIWP
jgi:alpha-methylacyl-CoA racemase